MVKSVGGFGKRSDDGVNAFFHRVAFAVARMRDQILGADEESAFDFTPEGCGGLRTKTFATRSKVNQVVVVDDERPEIVLFTRAGEEFNGARSRRRGAPHARAGGENLERVGADSGGGKGGMFERLSDRSVSADTQAAL